MTTISKERMDEMARNKQALKDKNLDAVAGMLIETREHNYKVQAEMVDLRRMVTQSNQQLAELRGEIAALKAMGFRGVMGTGSTVHSKE